LVKLLYMRDKILNIIKDILKQQKINVAVNDDTMMTEFKNLGIDSITVLNIIVCIEKEVGLRLDDSELTKIKTVNQLIAAFEAKTK